MSNLLDFVTTNATDSLFEPVKIAVGVVTMDYPAKYRANVLVGEEELFAIPVVAGVDVTVGESVLVGLAASGSAFVFGPIAASPPVMLGEIIVTPAHVETTVVVDPDVEFTSITLDWGGDDTSALETVAYSGTEGGAIAVAHDYDGLFGDDGIERLVLTANLADASTETVKANVGIPPKILNMTAGVNFPELGAIPTVTFDVEGWDSVTSCVIEWGGPVYGTTEPLAVTTILGLPQEVLTARSNSRSYTPGIATGGPYTARITVSNDFGSSSAEASYSVTYGA